MTQTVTLVELAREYGVDQKPARKACRKQQFSWHILNHPWTFPKDSPEESDVRKVLESMPGAARR